MKTEIQIDGKCFELNVDKALKMKLLLPVKNITKFTAGDVFGGPNHAQIVVVQPVWANPLIDPYSSNKKMFGFVGNQGGCFTYSNHTELLTYNEVLEYLNDQDLEFKGNVDKLLSDALKKMCKNDYCGT